MYDGIYQFGLPLKYAILCCSGGIFALFLANLFGLNQGGTTYLSTAIATGVGGATGGWIRQRKIKSS